MEYRSTCHTVGDYFSNVTVHHLTDEKC